MKKYIFMLITLVTLLVFQGYRMYHNMQSTQDVAIKEAIQKTYQDTEITKVNETYYFTGPKSYFVIEGENAKKEAFFVFVPDDKSEEIEEVKLNKGVTKKSIEQSVKKGSVEIIRVIPGKLNGHIVWEVVFKASEQSKWEYHFYDFYTGKWIKEIKLQS